jgi:hypothetical protein
MAKVCALRVLGFLLGVFFGFGGLFFLHLCVFANGGTIRQGALDACIVTLRPGAPQEMWVSGRSGRFGLDARRRSTLETFSSSVSDLAYIDAICGRKFRPVGPQRCRRDLVGSA